MSKPAVIVCLGWADGRSHDGNAGLYLASYDPDAFGGRGYATWTQDPAGAMMFADGVTAYRAWQAQSTVHPRRDDGKPNRPLTAYTVEIRVAPAEARP